MNNLEKIKDVSVRYEKSIEQSGEYNAASWKYQGELLYGNNKYGFFVGCEALK